MRDARCLAVMYHYVRDRSGGPDAAIRGLDPDALERQIELLLSELEPTDWPTLYRALRGERSMPHRTFLLTFDDGLRDHIEVAAPILEKHGIRGVFFASTAPLAERRLLAAHQIHLLLARLGLDAFAEAVARWHCSQTEDVPCPASVDSIAAESLYHYEQPRLARLKYYLHVNLSVEQRARLLDDCVERHLGSARELVAEWYMDEHDLAAMQGAGHTIGGHGHSHEMLANLPDDEVRVDLQRSTQILSKMLGPDHRPFSYPFGSMNSSTVAACRSAGYAAAFTTQPVWITAHSGTHELGRCDTIGVETFLEWNLPCIAS